MGTLTPGYSPSPSAARWARLPRLDLVAMGASGLLWQLQPGQAVEKPQTDIFPERTEAQMESVS